MARQFRKAKKAIYVFCEGESEKEYIECLKREFADVAAFHIPAPVSTRLFEDAKNKFDKDARFRNIAEAIDEIWFFFDAEDESACQWEKRLKIIKRLRGMRRSPNITVRLLMTSGCVEYWFQLHYEMAIPSLHTVADKERALHRVQQLVPNYKKGDRKAIEKIECHWRDAVQRGKDVLAKLEAVGMPRVGDKDSDDRDTWLHRNEHTFTTVHEAIHFLESLSE